MRIAQEAVICRVDAPIHRWDPRNISPRGLLVEKCWVEPRRLACWQNLGFLRTGSAGATLMENSALSKTGRAQLLHNFN